MESAVTRSAPFPLGGPPPPEPASIEDCGPSASDSSRGRIQERPHLRRCGRSWIRPREESEAEGPQSSMDAGSGGGGPPSGNGAERVTADSIRRDHGGGVSR